MDVTVHLPADIEEDLRRQFHNFDEAAKEAMLVELFRQDKLSQIQLARALGLDRFETEEVLHKHHVVEDLGGIDEYLADVTILEQLRSAGK